VVDSWIVSLTDLLSRLEMQDQPRHSSSITRLEPSRARVTLVPLTTTLLISETLGLMLMELTVPGTNFSDTMEPTSTINIKRFLM